MFKKNIQYYICFIISSLCLFNMVFAQDTLRITIKQAEGLFLEKNLMLIAERYNIDMAEAEVVQAKLFDNPTFSASLDICNPDNGKWFDASKSTGQYMFSIEQLIHIGGQRCKEVAMMKENVKMAENQFYDLLRSLHFSLHSIFYDIYYTLRSLDAFDTQISLLENLQEPYKELEKQGVVPLSEVVRIRSLLYSLQSDQLELLTSLHEKEAELQLLLQDNHMVFIPVIEPSEFAFHNPQNFILSDLIEKAQENRVDLRLVQNSLDFSKKNYALQKSLAIPNLSIGADYDKRGNFTDHLFCVSLAFDLPVFNRNQGHIGLAKIAVNQNETLFLQKHLEVENEVQKYYRSALDADKTSRSIDANFEADLQELLQSITENFKKKNISLLEFTDFYESYRDNIIKINQIQNQKAQAMEALRFVVGDYIK